MERQFITNIEHDASKQLLQMLVQEHNAVFKFVWMNKSLFKSLIFVTMKNSISNF